MSALVPEYSMGVRLLTNQRCCRAEVLPAVAASAAVVIKQAYVLSAMLASQAGLLKGGTIEFIAGFVEAGTGNVSLQLYGCLVLEATALLLWWSLERFCTILYPMPAALLCQ